MDKDDFVSRLVPYEEGKGHISMKAYGVPGHVHLCWTWKVNGDIDRGSMRALKALELDEQGRQIWQTIDTFGKGEVGLYNCIPLVDLGMDP